MKVEEKVLDNILREALSDGNKRTKTFHDRFKKIMFNMYNITPGESIGFLNGTVPVELMTKDRKFKSLKVLYEINKTLSDGFDISDLNVDKYFTERDSDNFNQKVDKDEQDEDTVIEQWLQVKEDQWVCVMSAENIVKLIKKSKIRYNPETQRNLTIKETKSGMVKQITYFPDAIKEIDEAMTSNNYISDDLTFNINPDKFEPPKVHRGNLVISSDSIMDCIDGFHRLRVLNSIKIREPEWEEMFIVNIMTFDKGKAIRYILQKDKKNHLTNDQVTESDQNDAANFIIKKLQESSSFYLRNSLNEKKLLLNNLINKIFEPKKLLTMKDRQNAVQLYSHIETNINGIIERNGDYTKELSKEEWFIYFYILKYCFDNNKDFILMTEKISVEDLLEKIRFTNKPIQKHFNIMSEVVRSV